MIAPMLRKENKRRNKRIAFRGGVPSVVAAGASSPKEATVAQQSRVRAENPAVVANGITFKISLGVCGLCTDGPLASTRGARGNVGLWTPWAFQLGALPPPFTNHRQVATAACQSLARA
eukprot:CAMPEP_0204298222 /NCGR_PEP_ID=MMETSP0468-20130131/74643_1 /ASSEMBLY_ACC=CAM_ASM_000383 /TAXON_ID=2969 /ORGANISM="Oxyrrhis marina" /LENGTH=118 /DNA_ID=CAMNT_0051277095 /DNA_START=280 /DNA_END=637 /DNA_ORIENTATION=-